MIKLKGCIRCIGDMLVEEMLGDVELVCIQCGHRQAVQAESASVRRPKRDAGVRKAA